MKPLPETLFVRSSITKMMLILLQPPISQYRHVTMGIVGNVIGWKTQGTLMVLKNGIRIFLITIIIATIVDIFTDGKNDALSRYSFLF
jgi:hypothetical protein